MGEGGADNIEGAGGQGGTELPSTGRGYWGMGSDRKLGGGGNKGEEDATKQAMVPDESRADVSIHGFWKWGTSTLFDMNIVNLDTSSYLRHTSKKALEMADKQKKDKYLQPCL